ncbi:MAG: ExeA family protein [bacterium]
MSYEQYFGFTEQPFSNAPDSRFYYDSNPHQAAMVKIMHAAETMKGLVVMLGDIGAGKTLLARKTLEKLGERDEFIESLLVMVHSEISASWILKRIALQIGIENPAEEKQHLLPQFYERLMELYEQGKKPIILIDEANMLKSKEIFEEFRGLLSLEVPGRKLLTLVLIGMPELEEHIMIDPPLQQRIAIKFKLQRLDKKGTENYINHRMKVAGAEKEVFSEMAVDAVYEFSKGTPRLINTICDNALLESFLLKKEKVSLETIEQVCNDLGLGR